MNNNRNQNNNRRRGRGNRNQGGGGNQSNRIDSRARGNAPQMLDKYKKLAEDAHRNGDRVQAEYYLQFADHYFRVIADNRSRQDEPRGDQQRDQRFARRDEREADEFEIEDEDAGDFGGEDRRRFESREPREGREQRRDRDRPRRDDRRDGRQDRGYGNRDEQPEGQVEAAEGPAFEPEDNPFVRDSRGEEDRSERPRRAPRARRSNGEDAAIDAAVLPPSFSANDANGEGGEAAEPAPRRRRKPSEGGTLSAVG